MQHFIDALAALATEMLVTLFGGQLKVIDYNGQPAKVAMSFMFAHGSAASLEIPEC